MVTEPGQHYASAQPGDGPRLPPSLGGSAALRRRRSRRCSAARTGVEVYVAGPGRRERASGPGASDDPATPGSWSPWTPISNDGGDISTLAPPGRWPRCRSSRSAPTCSSRCTAGPAAARAGSTRPTGRTWTSARRRLQLPPFARSRSSPAAGHPRPAVQQRTCSSAGRSADVRGQPGGPAGQPGGARVDAGLPAGGLLLRPGVPGEPARSRVSSPAALDWYRTVYDYSVPEQIRDIYYGLVLDEEPPAAVYTLPAGLAARPAEPARHRRDPALRLHPVHGAADRAVPVRLGGLAVHHRHLRVRRAGQDACT